jgi:hypothetical protein
MTVVVILFFGGIWYTVSAEKEQAHADKLELEVQEVVETLEAITTYEDQILKEQTIKHLLIV